MPEDRAAMPLVELCCEGFGVIVRWARLLGPQGAHGIPTGAVAWERAAVDGAGAGNVTGSGGSVEFRLLTGSEPGSAGMLSAVGTMLGMLGAAVSSCRGARLGGRGSETASWPGGGGGETLATPFGACRGLLPRPGWAPACVEPRGVRIGWPDTCTDCCTFVWPCAGAVRCTLGAAALG